MLLVVIRIALETPDPTVYSSKFVMVRPLTLQFSHIKKVEINVFYSFDFS